MLGRKVIASASVGREGKFANSLFQYAFLKIYARAHGLTAQTHPWIGNYLFAASDPPLDEALPTRREPQEADLPPDSLTQLAPPLAGMNVMGYFQYHTRYYAPHAAYFRQLFRPTAEVQERLAPALDKLRSLGRTVVGMHIRRTDHGVLYYYRAPTRWYRQWLAKYWSQFDNPVLFLASDDIAAVQREFADFNPVTSDDLGAKLPKAAFYPDHYLLSHANVMVIPNSSFSFTAALLNEKLQRAFRTKLSEPLGDPPFVEFEPWNADVIDKSAVVENFPHLPELARPKGLRKFIDKMRHSIDKRLRRLGAK